MHCWNAPERPVEASSGRGLHLTSLVHCPSDCSHLDAVRAFGFPRTRSPRIPHTLPAPAEPTTSENTRSMPGLLERRSDSRNPENCPLRQRANASESRSCVPRIGYHIGNLH